MHLTEIQDFLWDEKPVNADEFDCAPYRNHAEWLRLGQMPWWKEDLQDLVSPAVRNVTVLVSDTEWKSSNEISKERWSSDDGGEDL